MLATSAGVDVRMIFLYLDSRQKHYPRMAALGAQHGFARLTVEGDTLVLARQPVLAFGGVDVSPPPGAFVQAVGAAEAEMVRLVLAATAKAKRVADLFCGLGTFTFPLARRARVLAVDEKEDAIAALQVAARHAQGLKPIEAKVRDLFRMPLSAKELEGFDAAVFDPARSGAEAQAEELARSRVRTVVAVSCNPGTLARDVRILVDGGYALERVTPIDQFLFSHHVEAVAVLRR
jgi:23S rRNA (uracil1939-C5)-methyltransferase